MITNYFKLGHEPFFFDDHNHSSAQAAWDQAQRRRAELRYSTMRIVAFSPPSVHGAWDGVTCVGDGPPRFSIDEEGEGRTKEGWAS